MTPVKTVKRKKKGIDACGKNNAFLQDGILRKKRISSHKGHVIPNTPDATKAKEGESITELIKLQMMQRQMEMQSRMDEERDRRNDFQQMMQMMMLSMMPKNIVWIWYNGK